MRMLLNRLVKSRRGSILAILAVFLPATLGTMALAIDLSMLFQARVQAQRAADSAALGGAAAYLLPPPFSPTTAEDWAREYAGRNDIRGILVDPATEVEVQVRPERFQVYVQVRRNDIPTWFARFLGFPTGNVAAEAVAQATQAGGVTCMDPLAIADLWDDPVDDTDGNRVPDLDEQWDWSAEEGDRWNQVNSDDGNLDTGYGSEWRNAPYGLGDGVVDDVGRRLILKPQDPQDAVKPGYFQALNLPNSINDGASGWQDNFRNCNPSIIRVDSAVQVKTGDMRGPTRVIMNELYNADSGAYWDLSTGTVQGSLYQQDITKSPRVLMLMLYSPEEIPLMTGASYDIHALDFAYFFLESPPVQNDDPVIGRFMFYAQGVVPGSGPNQAQLTRILQLVD